MNIGQRYRLMGLKNHASSLRLVAMGLIPGCEISILRHTYGKATYYIKSDRQIFGIDRQLLTQMQLQTLPE